MISTIVAICLFFLVVVCVIGALMQFVDSEPVNGLVLGVLATIAFVGGYWFQTHQVVPTQYVGVSKSTVSQELTGPFSAGLVKKPFFGSVYKFPASTSYEKCEQYTPAIKGSYGVTVDLCFYYDVAHVDWLAEIRHTGSLDAGYIMTVWRNSVVSGVARSVKDYTPEELSDRRMEVEAALFENIAPWFNERGISLVRISFKDWVFTSEVVGQSFDESIVSQRKITEQTALFEAAKISREREMYEADTALLVAERQKESINLLGLTGDAAVQYLWIKALTDADKAPDVLILGTSSTPVSIPIERPNLSREAISIQQSPPVEQAP